MHLVGEPPAFSAGTRPGSPGLRGAARVAHVASDAPTSNSCWTLKAYSLSCQAQRRTCDAVEVRPHSILAVLLQVVFQLLQPLQHQAGNRTGEV